MSSASTVPAAAKKKQAFVPQNHKDILKFIMMTENGGALSMKYQKGLKVGQRHDFWTGVVKRMEAATGQTFNNEVVFII
jgi:hypothetical protein